MLLLCLAVSPGLRAQHLFPTTYTTCNADAFSLERDTITARTNNAELVKLLEEAVDEKLRGRVRGTLALQLLVDQAGNSCLLSLQNGTNARTSKLHLPQAINGRLKWEPLREKISPIVVVEFTEQGLLIKRHGFDMTKGRHELKDGRG